jgi:integrase
MTWTASLSASVTQVFGQAYKLAIATGQLTAAPRIRHLSETGNTRQGFFDAPDFCRVLGHLPHYLQDFTNFAYLCGWRCGEIKSLTWTDVDGDSIKLQAMHSKNRTARVIPLVGELAELIARRKLEMSTQTSLIFHNAGQPIGDFRKAWRTACRMAGVPVRLFHDLRRSAVRDMVRSGTPQTVAMSISGHKTASVFQRYSITDQRDQRKALLDRQAFSGAQIVPAEPDADAELSTEQIESSKNTDSSRTVEQK